MKQLLFSVTKKDLIRQTFRSGGKGGQNQNKVESGVRFIHEASGARGEARDSRDQKTNERNAFLRLVNSPNFKTWHKIRCSELLGRPREESLDEIKRRVDMELESDIQSGNVLIEEL